LLAVHASPVLVWAISNARMTMIDAVIEELKTHQTQLDQDGVMVGVSRQALEELLAHVAAPAHPAPIAGLEPGCPFCGRDPFHRIDNGIGMEAVAVTCCDLGDLFFRGARAAPSEVTLSWEEFMEIGNKIAVLRMSAAQLEAHAAEQVRPLVEALEGLIEAVELDADEGLEGIGSYTGARLTDAKNAIRARGQV
jgi:hypothetical protein